MVKEANGANPSVPAPSIAGCGLAEFLVESLASTKTIVYARIRQWDMLMAISKIFKWTLQVALRMVLFKL